MINGKLEWTIEGSFLTNEARKKYQESADIQEGVKFLQTCLIHFPENYATMVVTGKAKLTGCGSEVVLEDDDTEVLPYNFLHPQKPCEVDCGWISPDGKIYGHLGYNECTDHYDVAQLLIDHDVVKYTGTSPYNSVEAAGYIKFSPWNVTGGCKASEVTQKQLDAFCSILYERKRVPSEIITLGDHEYTVSDIYNIELMQFGLMITFSAERLRL